jgi:NADP-dependent 3-hydroxy acid dehydrogenase YdfG/acyl carrier protein
VLAGAGHGVFVEVSPHPVLTAAVTEILEDGGAAGGDGAQAVVTGTLRRDDGGAARVLASMAQVHVRGAGVDWAAVLGAGRRVELPTYAFQRQRYWPRPERAGQPPAAGQDGAGLPGEARFWAAVEGGDAAGLAQTLATGQEGLAGLLPALSSWRRRERAASVTAGWRYRVDWVPVPAPGSAGAGVLAGRWLMVVPAGEAGGELSRWCAAALAECGAGVVAAELPAGAGRAVAAGLVARVAGEAPLAGVVSLVGTDEAPLAGRAGVSAGLAGTLALVQGLEDAGLGTPLWLVTRGGVRAAGDLVAPRPGQAQVWGLGMVAGLEHPGWWGGLADVAGPLSRQSGRRLCAVLSGCGEDQVAIRPAGVLGRRLVRAAPPGGGTWRARGTVLATGATGSVGPHLVRWLGRSGAERVVLTSRGEPGRGTAALAAGLAAGGTEVCLARCDVADRGQVAGLVGRIGAGGPPLRAVVHAAVAVNLLPFGAVDDAELALTVSAKVLGARWLDELTAGLDLDAFVMFSSIAATWGSAEHAAYAAANAHLDALAWQRRARGLPATTIAWGVWDAGQWVGQDGAAGPRSVVPARLRRQGIRFLDPDLAFGALGAALADDETFLAVADVDWARFAPVFTATRPWRVLEDIPEVRAAAAPAAAGGGAVPGGELARRLAAAPGPERERLAAETVRGHAAAVLGYPSPAEVEPGRAFRDMGFDSLTAVELRDRLNTAAGLRLPATAVFDYPSPLALAREITRQLLGAPHDAPDDANTPAPIFVELQQLEATLGGISPDIHMRDQVTRRLQAILSEWIGAQGSAELTGADIELESATPDEVFSFFDRELGLS